MSHRRQFFSLIVLGVVILLAAAHSSAAQELTLTPYKASGTPYTSRSAEWLNTLVQGQQILTTNCNPITTPLASKHGPEPVYNTSGFRNHHVIGGSNLGNRQTLSGSGENWAIRIVCLRSAQSCTCGLASSQMKVMRLDCKRNFADCCGSESEEKLALTRAR